MVVVTNKNEGECIVPPDCFNQSFKEIGVAQGAQIVLYDMKNFNFSDNGDEGGEDENEEMEDEQAEEEPENAGEEKAPEVEVQ